MAKYETTDYAQMRRCRMAHLHGRMVDEHFKREDAEGVYVSGYIQMVSPDLTCWPLRWTITVEQKLAEMPALALVD
ncbi:hypothetical protein [Tardiphaga sp.]|uniref:hypothetical protein n=1 Tax=Tardiphaga sp. TaxID=1926292 RepID=UPI0026355F4B|nr:hypothetical protein [Tardiphaga sp.]MDB5616625.1 hypothetical protein [Tardiphaga sp.]